MEAQELDILKIILESGLVVKSVLIILILSSIVSWAIIFMKLTSTKRALKCNEKFLRFYRQSKTLDEVVDFCQNLEFSPFREMFLQGNEELNRIKKLFNDDRGSEKIRIHFQKFGLGVIERALKRGMIDSNKKLETYLSTLASIGSIAPFIGLFGTVWGIIDSFKGLAGGGATLNAVAPGIAEALVATAVGLFAAIPAVWYFNKFLSHNQTIISDMENFEQEFLNLIERSVA